MNALIDTTRFEAVENGLFFIVGCGRSGTTLVKSILDAHRQISLPHETNYFTGITRGDFGVGHTSLKQKLEKLLHKWWIADMPLNGNVIESILGDREPSWRNIFVAMLAALPNDEKVCCFGEKTVNHISYADELLEHYPTCRLIQVMRDPRASFASFRAAPIGRNQVSQFVKDWLEAAEVDKKLTGHPRYLRVLFEDVIRNTEGAPARIWEFLDVEFDREMLKFHSRQSPGYSPEQSHHQNTQKPIFQTGLEKWKKQLSKTQIGLLEFKLGRHMERVGLELVGADVAMPQLRLAFSSLVEWLSKNFVRRPRQLIKMIRAKRRQSKS